MIASFFAYQAIVRVKARVSTCAFFHCIVFFIAMFMAATADGQQIYRHGVFWGRLVLADRISDQLKWELYVQKRTQNIPEHKNIFGGPHFFSLWLWFNYQATDELKVSFSPIGYFDSNLFFTNPDDAGTPGVKEIRWSARAEVEKKRWLNYSNRYSVEYRMRDLQHDGRYRPNWRVRYQLKFEKPVKGILSEKKPVSFSVSDEIFIQFGKAVRGNANVFDQNRMAAGLGYEFLAGMKINVSYLNIRQQRINGKDFDHAHALWVVLTIDNLLRRFGNKHQEG